MVDTLIDEGYERVGWEIVMRERDREIDRWRENK